MAFWAVAATIAAGIQAIVGVYSSIRQGQLQSRTAAYNALIARQNAQLTASQMEIARKQKHLEEVKQQRKAREVLGAQRVGYAKAGVQEAGTPLMAEAELMTESEIDALAIRYASTVEQSQLLAGKSGFEQEEKLQRRYGKEYKTASYWGAGSSLLTGVEKGATYLGK